MSEIRHTFFEKMKMVFENDGYSFKKSKNSFEKKENGLLFSISFKFDGRGGLTMIDWIDYSIYHIEINKILKKIFGNQFYFPTLGDKFDISKTSKKRGIEFIPVMYSEKALELANNMNLKGLSALTFEEKYPQEKIQNCIEWIKIFYDTNITKYFSKCGNLKSIYQIYTNESPDDNQENPLEINRWSNGDLHFPRLMFFHLFCNLNGYEKPNFIKNYINHKNKPSINSDYKEKIELIEKYKKST
jgi:hypothetical protein